MSITEVAGWWIAGPLMAIGGAGGIAALIKSVAEWRQIRANVTRVQMEAASIFASAARTHVESQQTEIARLRAQVADLEKQIADPEKPDHQTQSPGR